MKRLIFIYGCLLVALYNSEEIQIQLPQNKEVNAFNLTGPDGANFALWISQRDSVKKTEAIKYCDENKHVTEIAEACLIVTRL